MPSYSSAFVTFRPQFSFRPAVFSLLLAAGFLAGCGGSSSTAGAAFSGNTTVVLLASSTANDQLDAYTATIETLTLTSQSGKQVTLLASPVVDEFIHLNGHAEPLATVTVPQGVYVSATATGANSLQCGGQVPGEDFHDQMDGTSSVTVNLPQPITVTGTAMGLILNLQATPSTPFTGGCPSSLNFVNPVGSVFNLTPMALANPPTTSADGQLPGLQGLVGTVDAGGSGFTVDALVLPGTSTSTWHAALNGSTVFQGVAGVSQLVPGLPVDMDLVIQPDGSLLATRVQVISTDTSNLTLATGFPYLVVASAPTVNIVATAQQGYLNLGGGGPRPMNFSSAQFQVSGQFANLASLPFTATFTSANIVAGQNLTLTTQATSIAGGPPPVSTLTLMPQSIDGTVSAISTAGNFTTYTVTLAPYDDFPQFAVQPGQTTLLTSPNTVVVYADSNTQMLNSSSIGVGGVFRFYGLIFNDNGTLRMDCAQINDGLAE